MVLRILILFILFPVSSSFALRPSSGINFGLSSLGRINSTSSPEAPNANLFFLNAGYYHWLNGHFIKLKANVGKSISGNQPLWLFGGGASINIFESIDPKLLYYEYTVSEEELSVLDDPRKVEGSNLIAINPHRGLLKSFIRHFILFISLDLNYLNFSPIEVGKIYSPSKLALFFWGPGFELLLGSGDDSSFKVRIIATAQFTRMYSAYYLSPQINLGIDL